MTTKKYGILISLFFSVLNISGQIVGSEAFIAGNYVQFGISECGAFGTVAAPPAWYFPNSTRPGIGIIADPQRDGWLAGAPFLYCGDYTIPDSPVEGWGLTFNGADWMNTHRNSIDDVSMTCLCGSFDVPGTNIGLFAGSLGDTTLWQGGIAGLNVLQESILQPDSLFILVKVILTNATTDTIKDVYYSRNVDPDQEEPWTGVNTTVNRINSQPSALTKKAYVTARGMSGECFLGLGSMDTRAWVSLGDMYPQPADDLYFAIGRFDSVGYDSIMDSGISIAFQLGDIPPGTSQSLAFVYVMDSIAGSSALSMTAPSCGSVASYLLDTVCGTYNFGGTILAASGTYVEIFPRSCGGDSVVTLDLTVFPALNDLVSWFPSPGHLVATEVGVTYQWVNCDSGFASISGETNQIFIPSVNGQYAVVLSNGDCTDTSACITVLLTASGDPVFSSLSVCPNPAENRVDITITPASANMSLEIMNYTGQVVWAKSFSNTTTVTADLTTLAPGVYFVKAKSGDQEKMIKVLKM
jgi:hypothetical protein